MVTDVTMKDDSHRGSFAPSEFLDRRRHFALSETGAATSADLAVVYSAEFHCDSRDAAIVGTLATAEALATVMYYNLIVHSPAYAQLVATSHANGQAFLIAGYEQERIHYNLLSRIVPALTTSFYFPIGMFTDTTYITTLNTLITLEDAFIAAYLIGIRDLSPAYRVLAGQILGVESEHRTLSRLLASDLGLTKVIGLAGTEGVRSSAGFASNNLAYERTFRTTLLDIVAFEAALGPFVHPGTSGFDIVPYSLSDATMSYDETLVSRLPNTIVLSDTIP